MLDLGNFLRRYAIVPRGVIHIGAHEGNELAAYQALGVARVVFIEANPVVYERLRARVGGQPGVTTIQAAVTDHEGTVSLNVTSMDQSSSILPLGLHGQIYPDIQVTSSVTVRASTVDALLAEHGLRAEDFNVINIDIQGAELLALRGAERTLRSIEFINTEVNLAELYTGCALLPDLEKFMAEHGLFRAALTTPYHPTWGDAIYVRRPVVTMTTLGKNGRFANQVFQYFALRQYAERWKAVVQTPKWVGQVLYGFDDPAPMLQFQRFDEEQVARSGTLHGASGPLAPAADLSGYFQPHASQFRPYREDLRRLCTPVAELRGAADGLVKSIRSKGRTLVALHLRRGDYGTGFFFRAPAAWYLTWLEGLWETLDAPVLWIASDDLAGVLPHFQKFQPLSLQGLSDQASDLGFFLDFQVLQAADALAISNSSYSYLAAMLNDTGALFARPHLPSRKLVPFAPWNALVTLRTELRPGEQQELDQQDQALHG